MQQPSFPSDVRPSVIGSTPDRYDLESLARTLFSNLPKNDPEFRALIAQRPALMGLVAVAVGSAVMQVILAATHRPPTSTSRRRSRGLFMGLATSVWSLLHKPATKNTVEQRSEVQHDELPLENPNSPRARPFNSTLFGFIKGGYSLVNQVARDAPSRIATDARAGLGMVGNASERTLDEVVNSTRNRPVGTLAVAAGVGFLLTWICASR